MSRAMPDGPGSHASHGAGQAVSALRVSIPIAWRAFLSWAFPFASVLVGGAALLASRDADGVAKVALFAGGFVFLLGALDAKADRAKAAETQRWAKLISDMIANETQLEINVNHTWESMRPHLDARIAELVAQAIEARRAETQSGSVHESAVAEGHAPDGIGNPPIPTTKTAEDHSEEQP